MSVLQETHNDLLALLAQEEVELAVYRDALLQQAGQEATRHAMDTARRHATERYGTYIDLRGSDGEW